MKPRIARCVRLLSLFRRTPLENTNHYPLKQKNIHASTDIYPLALSCGYSSTIGCSSSLLTNADC